MIITSFNKQQITTKLCVIHMHCASNIVHTKQHNIKIARSLLYHGDIVAETVAATGCRDDRTVYSVQLLRLCKF